MTQINHSAFSHMNNKPQAGKQAQKSIPVRTVAPPEAEQEQVVHQPAQEAYEAPENMLHTATSGIPGVMDDAAVQANLSRKKIFEKLVLFREDHVTEVDIGGLKFRLKLLNTNDNSFVLKQIKQIPPEEQVSKLAIMVLAAAVVDINGVKLEDVYSGPPDLDSAIMRRYYELSLWNSQITSALSTAYHNFQVSVEKEYTQDFLAK